MITPTDRPIILPLPPRSLADAWERWLEKWWLDAKERDAAPRLLCGMRHVRGLVDGLARMEAANDA